MVRRKYIRKLVNQILDAFDIVNPPVNVRQIAEALGAKIYEAPAHDNEDVSGYLLRDGASSAAIIGVNSAQPKLRRRFTIAHEIGHLLLHTDEDLHVDSRNVSIIKRNSKSAEGTDCREIEANLFAAELLMPEQFVLEMVFSDEFAEFSDETIIAELASKFEVSHQAITYRLANLDLLETWMDS